MKYKDDIHKSSGGVYKKVIVEELAVLKSDAKAKSRKEIREVKDIEDDLTDLKQVVQFLARGLASIWDNLPQDQKDLNQYKDNFDAFTTAVQSIEMRIDLEVDQVLKVGKILSDEQEFAKIVKKNYAGKK